MSLRRAPATPSTHAASSTQAAPRRRRTAVRWLVALVLVFLVLPTAEAMSQAKVDLVDIEDEVMCVVCQRPLSTSGGTAADDQRDVIQGFIDEGLTKQQVKDRLVVEYGKAVLVNDKSPVAAAAPIVAAIVGAGSIVLLLRRRRSGLSRGEPDEDRAAAELIPTDAEQGDPLAPSPTSAADDARIDAELAERG